MDLRAHALIGISAAATIAAPAFAAEKTYQVGDFKTVSVSAGIEAEITVGPAASARAEGTDEGLEKLEVKVDGDDLVIRRKPRSGFNWGNSHKVTVYVTTPTLTGVDVSSGAEAKASGIDADAFSSDISSGASASLQGACNNLKIDVSSGASLEAEDLKCKTVAADASSGASARVFASEAIVADASSGGSIKVYGSPKDWDIDESSGGDVSNVK
ncbi:MAG: head GIN domain-containing protein [Amphiplicatus sp.]